MTDIPYGSMCGIAGIIRAGGEPVARRDVEAMTAALLHRGPDGRGAHVDGSVGLGHTRLAVIDPSPDADQPMASDDEQVWIVFNGEIYDFQTHRRTLEARGRRFRTRSDTEVILHAYLEWGDDFIDRLDGMFAIAIYDLRRRCVKLYRDRPGIKPLYYAWDGRTFAFASELKAIETLNGLLDLSVDETAAYDFLTYRYVPTPKTWYREARKLPPATVLEFDVSAGRIVSESTFWSLPVDERPVGADDAAAQFRELTARSVDQQLVADVPVGFFLSGGIDSSTLVAISAARHSDLQTFSIGFDVASHTETEYARLVAERFGTRHHEAILRSEGTSDLFRMLRSWYDEPFGDTSAIPTYLVSETARRSVTVALSGDGGDELFGGYRWYRTFERLRPLARERCDRAAAMLDRAKQRLGRANPLRRAANALSLVAAGPLELYAKLMGGMGRAEKWRFAKLLEIDAGYDDYWHFRRYWRDDLPLRSRLQYLDFHTFLPDDILTKVDRASMAHALEVRVPLLDRKIIEFAFSLPESVRFHGGRLKGVMKLAGAGLLPDEILSRPKKGFSMPAQHEFHPRRRFQEVVLAELFDIRP